MVQQFPPSMGKSFGRGAPATTPPDTSGKRSKSEAFYLRPPGNCGSCANFIQGGDCQLVDKSSDGFDPGTIDEGGYCCLFESGAGESKAEEKAEMTQPGREMPMWETYENEEVAA